MAVPLTQASDIADVLANPFPGGTPPGFASRGIGEAQSSAAKQLRASHLGVR
jgi:hypothetical protein